MKYIVRNLIVTVRPRVDLRVEISKHLNIPAKEVLDYEILRESIDARKKNNLRWIYSIIFESNLEINDKNVVPYTPSKKELPDTIKLNDENPFIIGAGPAGLFCALELVERGFKPIVFDRGEDIDTRRKTVEEFWNGGAFNPESNVQFGEGGAGTFSDGKLTARNRNYFSEKVFQKFIEFGAAPEIIYQALPHLGTNGLHKIVKKIREYIISKGGEFRWNHKLEDVTIENDKISEVKINGEVHKPEILVLALGNAARETIKMLFARKVMMQSKPFAVGFRIEHSQEFINEKFYGKHAPFRLVGPATYKVTTKANGRGIYSFCMCPGGFVIAASSEENQIVVNGMSYLARNNTFGNSAIVCSVDQADYGTHPLAGMDLQAQIESNAYKASNTYYAPFQRGRDFLDGKISKRKYQSSYRPNIFPMDIRKLYTRRIGAALQLGLMDINKRVKGFAEQGLIIAPETRTSSPVRILRNNDTMASVNISNLYPIGEGSGYAGGIISSAVDGIRLAHHFEK